MTWLDDIARTADRETVTGFDNIPVSASTLNRLISEARKMERVRGWAERYFQDSTHQSWVKCSCEECAPRHHLRTILEDK